MGTIHAIATERPVPRRTRLTAARALGGLALATTLSGLVLLGGCASLTPLGETPVAAAPATPAAPKPIAEPTPNQREHQRILAAYGGSYEDARLEAMLSRIVDKLVAASERPDLSYQVTILNSPSINAFALPSGQLYVTRGLIALANDGSEIASVLSHEMAHVIARHAAFREDQARQAALVSRVANDLLADPQLGALALAKSKIALASFSRAQEFEADGIGVGIAARAGYDPYGAQRFLSAMGANATLRARNTNIDPRSPDFLSSHPATPERVSNATANARQFTTPGSGERERSDYLGAVEGMVYGEDPSEGFVRGRRFLHPKLGFSFQAPEGFVLDNTAQAVFGVKDGGAQAVRLDVVRVPSTQPLADYVVSGWIENIEPKSVERLTINGLQAATATARGDQWTFRLYVVRLGDEVYRFIFAAKQRTDAVDRSFREAVNSFHRMTAAEVQAARPQRLRIVKAGPGDTVERLARRMAAGDHQAERFRVINGLQPGDGVKPGDMVKIVVD